MMTAVMVGSSATMERTFTSNDVAAFAELSGDRNPVHLDEEYAAGTVFGRPIVHGALVASLFSTLLAEQLPGRGTIYLSQETRFVRPAYVGEALKASVEVTAIHTEKPIVTLRTTCTNSAGDVVLEGTAVVKAAV
jgi:acyl dehydratase